MSLLSFQQDRDGEAIQFSFVIGAVPDPATGGSTGGTPATVDGTGQPTDYDANEIDGTAIRSSDIKLIAEGVSQRPQVGWECLVDSVTYRVMNVDILRIKGADVNYVCQLR